MGMTCHDDYDDVNAKRASSDNAMMYYLWQVMGWGKVSSADDAEEQKSLYLARASTNKAPDVEISPKPDVIHFTLYSLCTFAVQTRIGLYR